VHENELGRLQESEGKVCPRVEPEPENAVAESLSMLLMGEHTREMFGPLFAAEYGDDSPRVRKAVVSRITAALASDVVTNKLFPKPKSTQSNRAPKRRRKR